MVAVLELARSAHLPPFQALHSLVEREAAVAADNLRLLAPLAAPCQALAAAASSGAPHRRRMHGCRLNALGCLAGRLAWHAVDLCSMQPA